MIRGFHNIDSMSAYLQARVLLRSLVLVGVFVTLVAGCIFTGRGGASKRATALSVGYDHSCAVLSDGEVKCWGGNDWDQLGNGKTTSSSLPVTAKGVMGARTVTAGSSEHSCAVGSGGSISCWGFGPDGELGNGSQSDDSPPVTVVGITDAVDVSAGESHACALLAGGTVWCWGDNVDWQLGDGVTTHYSFSGGDDFSASPVEVKKIRNATAISAGGDHTCALLKGETVWCWGWGGFGSGNRLPTEVKGLKHVAAISVGYFHVCAVLSTGSVVCWGPNDYGELGNGTKSTSQKPVAVEGITDAKSISAGEYYSCAVLSSGRAKCWGWNAFAELGNGVTSKSSTTPVDVGGITNAEVIGAGKDNTCVLLVDGKVKCWGWNGNGGIGDGTRKNSWTPVGVAGLS